MGRKKNTYDGKNIETYEGVEAVQKRPSLFVDSSDPTHILIEIIDNSLDEILTKNGSKISIYLNLVKGIYSVEDNGRGIPLDKNKKYKISTPQLLSTYLFSGGKFSDKNYNISSGTHGVGMCAVNALSSQFTINSKRKRESGEFIFNNGKLVSESIVKKTNKETGTTITFSPNKKYFNKDKINVNVILDKLLIANTFIKDIEIELKIEDKDGVHDVVLYEKSEKNLKIKLDKFLNKIFGENKYIQIKQKSKSSEIDIYFDFFSEKKTSDGFVNLLPVSKGTHINLVKNIAYNAIKSVQSKNKIYFGVSEFGKIFSVFVGLFTPHISFRGQYKDTLMTSEEMFKDLEQGIFKEFKTYFSNNMEKTEEIIISGNKLKMKKDTKNINLVVGKKITRGVFDKGSNLIDCSSDKVEGTELFIVEGKSAGGTIFNCRDKSIHAIFSMKGKPNNISNLNTIKNIKNILEKEKVTGILEAIGIDPITKKHNIKYEKVILLADADNDGQHIICLLMILFSKLCPELIDKGIFYLCEPPLYGYNKGKDFIPIYNEKEREVLSKKGIKLTRFKGLGEMNPSQLYTCAIDKKTRKLVNIVYNKDDIEDLLMYSKNVDGRKRLMEEEI